MAEPAVPTETQVEVARAKPLTGALLGIGIGLALAIVLQQQGVWPPDKLLLFLLPAVVGLIGLLLTTMGRRPANTAMVVALVLLLGIGGWGATGFASMGDRGQLNGGCTVDAASSIDSTIVTDTSSGNPFDIDPDGSLSWTATSPEPFQDYEWEIWVEVGGFEVVIDGDFEDNDDLSQTNEGNVANVSDEAEARGIPLDQLRGVFEVGGFAATCDGFAFVRLVSSGPLETLAAKIAAIIGVLLLAILLLVAFTARKKLVEVPVADEDAATMAAGSAVSMGGEDLDDGSSPLGMAPSGDDRPDATPDPFAEPDETN